jgi:hypothetical protein
MLKAYPSGSLLALPTKPWLERSARDKHSSLFCQLINYEAKKFYNIDLWSQCFINFLSVMYDF